MYFPFFVKTGNNTRCAYQSNFQFSKVETSQMAKLKCFSCYIYYLTFMFSEPSLETINTTFQKILRFQHFVRRGNLFFFLWFTWYFSSSRKWCLWMDTSEDVTDSRRRGRRRLERELYSTPLSWCAWEMKNNNNNTDCDIWMQGKGSAFWLVQIGVVDFKHLNLLKPTFRGQTSLFADPA